MPQIPDNPEPTPDTSAFLHEAFLRRRRWDTTNPSHLFPRDPSPSPLRVHPEGILHLAPSPSPPAPLPPATKRAPRSGPLDPLRCVAGAGASDELIADAARAVLLHNLGLLRVRGIAPLPACAVAWSLGFEAARRAWGGEEVAGAGFEGFWWFYPGSVEDAVRRRRGKVEVQRRLFVRREGERTGIYAAHVTGWCRKKSLAYPALTPAAPESVVQGTAFYIDAQWQVNTLCAHDERHLCRIEYCRACVDFSGGIIVENARAVVFMGEVEEVVDEEEEEERRSQKAVD